MAGSSKKMKKTKAKSTTVATDGTTQVPKCHMCDEPCAVSSYTKDLSTKCETHLKEARIRNRKSYHNRGEVVKKTRVMEGKLADRNNSMWTLKRKMGENSQKLVLLKTKYDALEKSYEESQKSLMAAVDAANSGKKLPENLAGSSVSLRNEATVMARLGVLETLMTKMSENAAADREETVAQATSAIHETQEAMEDVVSQLQRILVSQDGALRRTAAIKKKTKGSVVQTPVSS